VKALADAEVGKLLNEHFAAGFQKVGTFKIVNGRKTGGNVATYFCTADARVLHAIAGPVDAATLLREAKWVLDIHDKAKKAGKEGDVDYVKFVRQEHAVRLERKSDKEESAKDRRSEADRRAEADARSMADAVDSLLVEQALDDIDKVYPKVWEGILKEKISDDPVRYSQ